MNLSVVVLYNGRGWNFTPFSERAGRFQNSTRQIKERILNYSDFLIGKFVLGIVINFYPCVRSLR